MGIRFLKSGVILTFVPNLGISAFLVFFSNKIMLKYKIYGSP